MPKSMTFGDNADLLEQQSAIEIGLLAGRLWMSLHDPEPEVVERIRRHQDESMDGIELAVLITGEDDCYDSVIAREFWRSLRVYPPWMLFDAFAIGFISGALERNKHEFGSGFDDLWQDMLELRRNSDD